MSRLNRPTLLLPTRAHGRTQAAENQREQAPTTDPSPVGDICRTEFCAFRKRPGGDVDSRAASGQRLRHFASGHACHAAGAPTAAAGAAERARTRSGDGVDEARRLPRTSKAAKVPH